MSLYGKGEALRGLNKFKESLKYYDDALKLDQQHYRAYYEKEKHQHHQEEFRKYQNVRIILFKYFQKIHYPCVSKGACLIQLNKFKEAQQVIEQAKLINPQSIGNYKFRYIAICNQNLK